LIAAPLLVLNEFLSRCVLREIDFHDKLTTVKNNLQPLREKITTGRNLNEQNLNFVRKITPPSSKKQKEKKKNPCFVAKIIRSLDPLTNWKEELSNQTS